MQTPTPNTENVLIELDGRTAYELGAICTMLNISHSEAISYSLKFFCQGCKDTLKNFALGVRTPALETPK